MSFQPLCFRCLIVVLTLCFGQFVAFVHGGEDWLPIKPEDLALKESPVSPGAPAVVLHREVHTDDVNSVETRYYRIKILTKEGRERADVEIPFIKSVTRVGGIKARTIRPDGSEVKFDGEIFEKVIVKARRLRVLTKTFTMPEAEVGSIIEYKYELRWDLRLANSPNWIIDDELPTLHAEFSFRPYPRFDLAWTGSRLPPGVTPRKVKNSGYQLSVDNIPAFVEEDYMPPESAVRMKVSFFYLRMRNVKSAADFWIAVGKNWRRDVDDFIGRRKKIARAAEELAPPGGDPEARLRRIYERVQEIRNLSYETLSGEERDKLKDNNHVEDVWERGYGYRSEINRLFVALAQAAGFEADVVPLTERDTGFLDTSLPDPSQLDGEIALVKLGGEERFFDPGVLYCPFGFVYWPRTGVNGLKLSKDGGEFIVTVNPESHQAVVERKATLQLDEEGSLRGRIVVTFRGRQALERRLDNQDADEAGRRESVENDVKSWFPGNAVLKFEPVRGWEDIDASLQVEAEVEVPYFAVSTGHRLLIPVNIFQSARHPFAAADRIHPVYFSYPFEEHDHVQLRTPPGFELESLPEPRSDKQAFGAYEIESRREGEVVHLKRRLALFGFYFPVQYYGALRSFYNGVRSGDESQFVLRLSESGESQ